MVKSKEKGGRWELEATKLLNKRFPGTWKKIAMSGSLGSILNIPILKADVIGEYKHISYRLMGDCKVGYGGKNMTIQKEWFDKIRDIAEENYALPVVILKFEKSRSGVRYVICMDFDTWDALMTDMGELYHELKQAYISQNG